MFDNLTGPIPPAGPDGNAIIKAVRSAFTSYFEEQHPGEAQLTFLGSSPLKLLRFGPDTDRVVTYATLGCSAEAMQDPSAMVVDTTSGPRAELVLPIRGGLDEVVRPLGILAASPSIEGLVLTDGALIDFGQPLWNQSRFTGFVLTTADIPAVSAEGTEVTIFQPVPATTNEFALARAKGVDELQRVWREQGVDFTDPHRTSAV
ncbi:MAG: suppressor of fused domain protein [Corynebacterium sp.]|uniref:suppressor of fused domain protein n=1 Tax=Corynebacterium sp. TaxID=1720 RepID=UPI0026DCBE69|nr:suppressor of fused domain protein [Corynebacterium sp.]MDO5029480.1 suppressor of fused domain protein [Corynebacterium sp.]